MAESDAQDPLVNRLNGLLNKYESILLLIWLVLFLLRFYKFPVNIFFVIVSSILAILFFYGSYSKPPEGVQQNENFLIKLSGIGAAMTVIGIMFTAMQWPNSMNMLIPGLLTQIVYIGYVQVKKQSVIAKHSKQVLRAFILLICAVLCLFLDFS